VKDLLKVPTQQRNRLARLELILNELPGGHYSGRSFFAYIDGKIKTSTVFVVSGNAVNTNFLREKRRGNNQETVMTKEMTFAAKSVQKWYILI